MPAPSLPLVLWQPNNPAHYRKQDGTQASVGDKVRFVGAPGYHMEQPVSARQATLKSDAQGLYLEFAFAVSSGSVTAETWYSLDAAGTVLSSQEWAVSLLYDGAAGLSAQTLLCIGGSTASAILEITAFSIMRLRLKGDDPTMTTVLANSSGQGPKAGVPNVISATTGSDVRYPPRRDGNGDLILNDDDRRTYTYLLDSAGNRVPTIDRRGYLRVDGGMATTWTTDAENMVAQPTEVGNQTFQTLTLGATRTLPDIQATNGLTGKVRGCVVLSRKAADRFEIRGMEEYLQGAVSNPAAVPFAPEEGVCYVSNAGSDANTGRIIGEPVRTHAQGMQYFPLVYRTFGTEGSPYRGSFTFSRPYWARMLPWPGYDRCVWHASALYSDGWTAAGVDKPNVYYRTLTDILPGQQAVVTPGASFLDIPGFLGMPRLDLRKVPGQFDQTNPAFGEYGWDIPSSRIYVHVGMDPNGHPCEIGQGVGISAWRRGGGLEVYDHSVRYASNSGFNAGDGAAGDQRPIGGGMRLYRCLAAGCGVLTGGGFGISGNGDFIEGHGCVVAGGPNDGLSPHCQGSNRAGGEMRFYDFIGFGCRDQIVTWHDGCRIEVDRFWAWDAGDSVAKGVYNQDANARITEVVLRNGFLWSGGTVLGQAAFAYSDYGARAEISNCAMDERPYFKDYDRSLAKPLNAPTPYIRTYGNRVRAKGAFTPPPLPSWAQ